MSANKLFVISGPSGVGKGTLAKMLIENEKDIKLSISCTTRTARVGEVHGKDYFFISKEEFLEKVDKGGFLEYSNHFDSYYGTPKDYVEESLKTLIAPSSHSFVLIVARTHSSFQTHY